MQVVSIDRFEGNYAVCELENGQMIDILKSKFNYDVNEGDIINIEIVYELGKISDIIVHDKNEEEKQRRLKAIKEKLKKIKRK